MKDLKNRFVDVIFSLIPLTIKRRLEYKYIIEPRNREILNKNGVAPLFETVFLEVRTKCNGSCTFCAASIQNEARKDIEINTDLYLKIINELSLLNYNGRFAFHVNNDPLLFKNLPEFVKIAREKLPNAWIQIMTNGKLLGQDLGERLINNGIDEMYIDWYRKDLKEEMPIRFIKFEELVNQIKTKNIIKNIPYNSSVKYHPEQYKPGKDFIFTIRKRKLREDLSNRAGSAPNKNNTMNDEQWGMCEYPFTEINITADGRVAKCCADFYFADPMGSLTNHSLIQIWYGKKFIATRERLKSGDRSKLKLCNFCDEYNCTSIPKGSLLTKLIYYGTVYQRIRK